MKRSRSTTESNTSLLSPSTIKNPELNAGYSCSVCDMSGDDTIISNGSPKLGVPNPPIPQNKFSSNVYINSKNGI